LAALLLNPADKLLMRDGFHMSCFQFLFTSFDLVIGHIRSWWRQRVKQPDDQHDALAFRKGQNLLLDFCEFHGFKLQGLAVACNRRY
jgi:hypothetical protein